MLRNATLGLIGLATLLPVLRAQDLRLDWRRIGNSAVEHPLGDFATGPIERAWYTADGNISVRTRSGVTLHFDGRLGELPNLEGKPFHPLARRRDIFVCGDAKSVVRPNAAFGLAWRAWSR